MRPLRDAKYLTSSVFASLVLASARSVLLLRILGPALMGAWKSALLVDSASEVARMGVSRAMGIRVPVLTGQGDQRESDRVISATGALMFWLAVAMGIVIFSSSLLASNRDLRISLQLMAAIIALTQPYYFLRELAGAHHLFVLRSKETLLRSVVDVVGAVVLCKLFGLVGLGTGTALALVVAALYLKRRQTFPFHFHLDMRKVRELMRVGLPFSLTEAGFELARRVDVLLMALMLGPTFVGYYGISLLIMDFSEVLAQKGVAQVLSPHLLREFGRTRSFREVAVFYERPARLFCYVLPPLLGSGSFLIGDFVRLVLPQYASGIGAAQITIWTIFFVVLHCSISSFFVAAEMLPVILRMYGVVIPIAAAGQYFVMKAGLGLQGVAWCAFLTLGAVAAAEIAFAKRSCGHNARAITGFLGSLLLPLVCSMVLRSLVAGSVFDAWIPVAVGTPLGAVFKAFIFLLLYMPVLVAYEGRFRMLRTVGQAV